MSLEPIYATLAWGFEPDTWGAIGFSHEKTRNALADNLRRKGGSVLTIGTMGTETAKNEQGRILGLHKVGTMPVRTEQLVEPSVWAHHLRENGGSPKWPFGLPIISAERFNEPQPLRKQIAPRLHDDVLHMKLATNYEELTEDEAILVLKAARTAVPAIWSTPLSAFATRRMGTFPKGPKPSLGSRTLSASSGPTATYCFTLAGTALSSVSANIVRPGSGLNIYKVGFSNDPDRRRCELNAYLPDDLTLNWRPGMIQWHEDEINAWAMEQEIFRQMQRYGAHHIKGEMFAAQAANLDRSWHSSILTTMRKADPVVVMIGQEEQMLAPGRADGRK